MFIEKTKLEWRNGKSFTMVDADQFACAREIRAMR